MSLNSMPIKRKVVGVIMLTTVAVLALTVTAFMSYELMRFRGDMEQNLATLAGVVADNSTAALQFKDLEAARETLMSLQHEPQVISAALYDDTGKLFITYTNTTENVNIPAKPGPFGHYFDNGKLVVFEPVTQSGRVEGTLALRADMRNVYANFETYAAISGGIVICSIVLALLLSNNLQRRISDPVLALARAARAVAEEGDYSVRAAKLSNDELGLLTDAFNQMLNRIQHQTVALQEKEARLRLALEASRTGTWDWNTETGKVTWDRNNTRLFGLEAKEFEGTYAHFVRMLHPEDVPTLEQSLKDAVEQKQEFSLEFRAIWPDGSVHHLYTRGKAFYDPTGKPVRMTGVTLNMEEQRRAEEARAFLAAIVESTEDAIVGKDLSGRVQSWNRGAERMFGYTAEEMIGESIQKVIAPENPDEEQTVLDRARRGETWHYETTRLRKDGSSIHVSLSVSPIRGPGGKIVGVSSISRDISERIAAQEALERNARRLREQSQMLDLANVLVRDLEDRVIMWSTGLEKMYGWDRAEVLGRRSHKILQTRFDEPLEEIRATLMRTGGWTGELVHKRKDGEEVIVASEWVLHKDPQGRPSAILEVDTDITARKRAEQQMQLMNLELEQRVRDRTSALTSANQELEAFTYSVAHDLRAPLRHVDAFAKILEEDFAAELPEEVRRYLHNMRKASQNMSRLVDDLLNLARVGRQELRREQTPLNRIVSEVIKDLDGETRDRRVEWRIAELPVVESDPGLVKQVFVNLLSNAVKYTRPRETAVIEVGTEVRDGERAVYVRDNGVGFNMKFADKLFGVFQRLHRAEEFEGTGVGLAIVNRIVQKHGGHVWGEAELDKGASFYFTLNGAPKPRQKPRDASLSA